MGAPRLDEQMMRRAIDLAMRGRGRVEPNPMVGCVIARGDQVLGEGWHQTYGGPHAERQALAGCAAAGNDPRGASVYVTLEPCCHSGEGKKTPPCVPALTEAAVSRVVVGCVDPNPKVSGRGLAQLRQAGIAVDAGVLEADARQLIAPFIAGVVRGRPYVTLKWAQSADGKVAGAGGRRVQISNERSMRVVHELRARCDAILVGINTVLTDDPTLTVRGVAPMRPLHRVILDSHLRIPADSKLVRTGAGDLRVYALRESITRRGSELQRLGVNLVGVDDEAAHISLPAVLRDLYKEFGLTHALVDAGPTLARAFLDENLADRLWVFRSPKVIGEQGAPQAVPIEEYGLLVTGSVELDADVLTEYLNPNSDVFAAAERSADLMNAQMTA